MDIVLTQKDADWIANVMRDKIKSLDEGYDSIVKAREDNLKLVNSLIKAFDLQNDEEIKKHKTEAELSTRETISKIHEAYQKSYREYERIIELMMTGSCA